MTCAFISYSRRSERIVPQLIDDLRASGIEHIWWDKNLSGGQSWWDTILQQIREADILVCLVDSAARESLAVTREYKYANDLGKTILPVLVSSKVRVEEFPVELAGKQYVDYRPGNTSAFNDLYSAIHNLPLSPPIPNPLPVAPELPRNEIDYLSDRLSSAEPLSLEAQNAVFNQLRRFNKSDDRQERDFAEQGLRTLRRRNELNANVAADISALGQKKGYGKPLLAMLLIALTTGGFVLMGMFQQESPNDQRTVSVDSIDLDVQDAVGATVSTEPETEESIPDFPETAAESSIQPLAEFEPVVAVTEMRMESHTEAKAETTKSKTTVGVDWHQDFSVFEETPFELCGYDEFTVASNAYGSELVVRSRDRSIPDTPFRGLEAKIAVDHPTEIFNGCRVLFNYTETASVARIRVRSYKEM